MGTYEPPMEEPGHLPTMKEVNDALDDDARDRARFGGPITDAMLHTALRVAAYDPTVNPQMSFNLATLAVQINSWLRPVRN